MRKQLLLLCFLLWEYMLVYASFYQHLVNSRIQGMGYTESVLPGFANSVVYEFYGDRYVSFSMLITTVWEILLC